MPQSRVRRIRGYSSSNSQALVVLMDSTNLHCTERNKGVKTATITLVNSPPLIDAMVHGITHRQNNSPRVHLQAPPQMFDPPRRGVL